MMTTPVHVLAFDVGTTGVKTCLFRIGSGVDLLASAQRGYDLTVLRNGGIEQDPDQWWEAMAATSRQIVGQCPDEAARLDGISFCSQMQSVVLVDEQGRHVRPAMSYMDQRAVAEYKAVMGRQPRVAGMHVPTMLTSLRHTGAVAASIKDPVWKYHWVRAHEPEVFARARWWLDVKDALAARMTGRCVMSEDSAFATLLYDVRSPERRYADKVVSLLGVDPKHLPPIVGSSDVVGPLRAEQAAELGLPPGVPVFSGGGDASLIGVGAGATDVGDTHVYMGTSGWVSTVTDKVTVDVGAMIATVVGAIPGRYNYFAELETAGKCLAWVRDHLALDEINIYLDKRDVSEEDERVSLYDYLSKVIATAPAGSGGVLFAPWLHGNRCPFEDPNARAMFVNIGLDTGKTELLRSVIEGVCYHLRWFLETQRRKVPVSGRVRFVGGGALSAVTAQILADVLQRGVDVVEHPENVGAVGAGLVAAAGLGVVEDVAHAKRLVTVARSFQPDPSVAGVYDRMFGVFTQLHRANRKLFARLNGGRHE